ncbi:MAG: LamG domain-containing protein [Planctomycetes bacterium]|nr:LamG domain-containing protein [Planctomycetota bacterium]
MSLLPFMPPVAAAGAYTANNGASFNASDDWLVSTSNVSGLTNSKYLLYSGWLYLNNLSAVTYLFGYTSNAQRIRFDTSGHLNVQFKNASNSLIVNLSTDTGAVFTTGSWFHLGIYMDLNIPIFEVYIDTVLATDSVPGTLVDDTVNWNVGGRKIAIGAEPGGSGLFDGYMQDVYINFSETLDLGVSANLEKFRTSGSKPVGLGSDGSTPTGTAPEMYFRDPYNIFETNSGSGVGSAFVQNATLDEAPSSPSD